jgi:hypothetical protein
MHRVILFLFWGISDIEQEKSSQDLHKEFKIVMMSHMASFVIAVMLGEYVDIVILLSGERTFFYC